MEAILVCCRIVDALMPPPPGSRRQRCAECRAAIWVSPASEKQARAAAVDGAVKYVCLRCHPPGRSMKVEPCSPGVVEEAVAGTGDRDGVLRVIEQLTGKRPEDA